MTSALRLWSASTSLKTCLEIISQPTVWLQSPTYLCNMMACIYYDKWWALVPETPIDCTSTHQPSAYSIHCAFSFLLTVELNWYPPPWDRTPCSPPAPDLSRWRTLGHLSHRRPESLLQNCQQNQKRAVMALQNENVSNQSIWHLVYIFMALSLAFEDISE